MEYAEIFDGMRFNTGPETWVAAVENKPAPVDCSDRVCFVLRFTPDGRMSGSQERRVKLWASQRGIEFLEEDVPLLHQRVLQWLENTEVDGEVECFD